MRLLEKSLSRSIYKSLYEGVNQRAYKVGDIVYWVGAGNEISAIGTIVEFPTNDRMTIKWEDGDVNTYSTTHPDIQHEDDYEDWINEDGEDDTAYYGESAKPKTVKEYRIIDNKTKKVLKVFKAEDEEKGYEEMREMGKKLKKDGKEDNLIYKEFTVKNKLKESFFVKIWNEAAEDYQDYLECNTKEEAERELAELKKNGEKGIIENFSENSRDPELTDEVEFYNKTFNESASRVIWTSETTEDDYDKDELKTSHYQDYLDDFDGTVQPDSYEDWLDGEWLGSYLYHEFNDEANEYEEWYDFITNYPEEDLKRYYQDYLDDINEREPNKPKEFDEWFEDYIVSDADNQWQYREEDLRDNVLPMIDKQVNGAIFITGNYNSNYPDFRKSGPGGKIVSDGDALINWLSDEDKVEFTNEEGDQVGVYAADHDGSIGGLLFTLPNDPHKVLEIALSTDYYDKNDYSDNNEIIDEFMQDLSDNDIDMRDIKKPELLVPIKNGFLLGESAKPKKKNKKEKKPEERIIMQQGNVTCLKKDNKFKVFEDADTNLAEYDNQEEAMRDALNRCGVNPDNELAEEKDNLKEQVDEALRRLLKKKEDLRSDDTITDEEYYDIIERIDNIMINSYTAEEIEEAKKELGIE